MPQLTFSQKPRSKVSTGITFTSNHPVADQHATYTSHESCSPGSAIGTMKDTWSRALQTVTRRRDASNSTQEPAGASLQRRFSFIKSEARKAFKAAKHTFKSTLKPSAEPLPVSKSSYACSNSTFAELPTLPDSSFLQDVLHAAEETTMMDFSLARQPPQTAEVVSSASLGNPDHTEIDCNIASQIDVDSVVQESSIKPVLGDYLRDDKGISLMLATSMINHDLTSSEHGEDELMADNAKCEADSMADRSNVLDEVSVSEEDDYLELFRPVMACLDLGKLAQIALLVRLSLDTNTVLKLSDLPLLTCKVMNDPLSGQYNLAYTIHFSDGTLWMARIPGHGTPDRFGDLDAEKMNCEYQTMEFIRKSTTIPMPKLYFWETTCTRVGAPFALMEYVRGRALEDAWHEDFNDQQRLDTLSSIAGYMSQLQTLSFDRIGMLRFNETGGVKEVGQHILLLGRDGVSWAITEAHDPHADLMESLWDCYHPEEEDEGDMEQRSALSILSMALDSVPGFLTSETCFALTTAELNYQNIKVNAEGKIVGFLDWDLAHTDAASSGYARYPVWINEDWNSADYPYADDATNEEDAFCTHTPEKLHSYRRHYAEEMAKYASSDPTYDPRMTELSHIVEAIAIGSSASPNRSYIVNKLLSHAFKGTSPFRHADYMHDYKSGDTQPKDEMIKRAFKKMWRSEWEDTPMNDGSIRELEDVESVVTVITADNVSERSSIMSTKSSESQNSGSEFGTPETESFEIHHDAKDGHQIARDAPPTQCP